MMTPWSLDRDPGFGGTLRAGSGSHFFIMLTKTVGKTFFLG